MDKLRSTFNRLASVSHDEDSIDEEIFCRHFKIPVDLQRSVFLVPLLFVVSACLPPLVMTRSFPLSLPCSLIPGLSLTRVVLSPCSTSCPRSSTTI